MFQNNEINNKLSSTLIRVIGYFLLFIAITQTVFAIIDFSSIEKFINNISSSLMVILISMLMLTQYYTFNNDNLTWHFYFLKKNIPYYKMIEIKYYIFGFLSITMYGETLNKRGKIFIALFCSKKKSIRKLDYFLKVLEKKNMSCVINI